MVTTIQIQDDTWKLLNERKKLGETFDDVIQRMSLECPKAKRDDKGGHK